MSSKARVNFTGHKILLKKKLCSAGIWFFSNVNHKTFYENLGNFAHRRSSYVVRWWRNSNGNVLQDYFPIAYSSILARSLELQKPCKHYMAWEQEICEG